MGLEGEVMRCASNLWVPDDDPADACQAALTWDLILGLCSSYILYHLCAATARDCFHVLRVLCSQVC